jgi:hypothetical protein
MNKNQFPFVIFLVGFLIACGGKTVSEKQAIDEKVVEKADLASIETKSAYSVIIGKYKLISFDTLKVYYNYDDNDKRFSGKELSLKEAGTLPIGVTEKYFGKLSGVYACYRFLIDSTRLGLVTRIPSEYESSSIVLLIFDRKKDKFQDDYFYLGTSNGDAGEISVRVSWLFQTRNKQFQSFVYDYQSAHEIDDTLTTESRYYFLIDCMKPEFDTISSNQTQLKKRFKGLLRTEE